MKNNDGNNNHGNNSRSIIISKNDNDNMTHTSYFLVLNLECGNPLRKGLS